MVVFGAGASHGSRRHTRADGTLPPPLTAALFGEEFGSFAARYPASRPAIVHLRQALERHPNELIEEAIGRLYEEASRYAERARHLLALRFYLSDLIQQQADEWWEHWHGFTLYAELLERLGAWRAKVGEEVVLVTFNYDTLLDRSLEAQVATHAFTGFASYTDREDWRLYKLHGSTNWARVLKGHVADGSRRPNSLIAEAERLDVGQGELRATHWDRAVEGGETAVAVPGIAVPTNLKQTFECPDAHLRQFTDEITRVDRLLTIGWRAAEPHALELLAERIQPGINLGICDIDEQTCGTVLENLGLTGRRSRSPQPFSDGFAGLLEHDLLERWLDRPVPFMGDVTVPPHVAVDGQELAQ
jgi:hypothetical protein